MFVLFSLVVFSTLLFSPFISDVLPVWAVKAQSVCTASLSDGPYREIYSGLVCGTRLPASSFKTHLIQTGLFHLLVASGAHLAFVEGVLRFVLRRRFEAAIPCVLLLYALLTGLCPPFLRALFHWGFRSISNKLNLGWTPLQSLTLAGFAALLLCNRQGELVSLAFSWIAGLAVHISSEKPKGRREISGAILFQVSIYALMIPPTLALATPHPLSILWNLILGPVLTFILFPAALMNLLLPKAWAFLPNRLLDGAHWIVRQAADVTPRSLEKAFVSPIWIWIYLFVLVLASHFFEQQQKRSEIQ